MEKGKYALQSIKYVVELFHGGIDRCERFEDFRIVVRILCKLCVGEGHPFWSTHFQHTNNMSAGDEKSIPYLVPTQIQESIYPPITALNLQDQFFYTLGRLLTRKAVDNGNPKEICYLYTYQYGRNWVTSRFLGLYLTTILPFLRK